MPDLTIAESLLYSTVKLTASNSGSPISTGTGFFMQLAARGETTIPCIVTNKHVVNGSDQVTAICHFADGDRPSGRFVSCNMAVLPGSVIAHPDANVDLCAIPIGPIMNQAAAAGTPLFLRMLAFDIVPKAEDWEYFDAIEEVTMIGCPNGISDEANNLPIVRRGITASSLAKRYNGKDEFMVDMACFPGSSGSPIFIYDRNGFLDRRNNSYMIGTQRILLVGILYAGPQIENNGHIILGQPPKVAVAAMMHLGNAIRASALKVLDEEARRLLPALSEPETNIGAVVQE